ncbi:MAG: class I SAM-dependent methyltransferase [Dehalococcoidales bacterium]|nr:class I SAM-dependent methyltransferase [Dehalococcoidales bacterium]
MFTNNTLNNYEWRRLHEKLDRAIAEAALGYLHTLTVRRIPIKAQQLSNELDELRLGREPDYDVPGIPLVYALKYMPKRVVSIFGSLLSVLDDWHPKSVLDIGSGTGATALAVDLLDTPHHINLLGIEPSQEMILFSECSGWLDHVSAKYKQGSIADLVKDRSFLIYDLTVFSACFPYGFDNWSPLLTALGDYEGQESKMILAVEPDAKSDLLVSFRNRLASKGWPTITFCCHDLPDVIKDNTLPLPQMLNVWQRLGMNDSDQPRTWWNPPDDKFLVANPKPTQASQSLPITGTLDSFKLWNRNSLYKSHVLQ